MSAKGSFSRKLRRLLARRHDLSYYWSSWDKGSVVFLSALAVPVAAIGFMARFAYLDHARAAAERQRNADLTCLAENVYFEARGEPLEGQYAVAEVTLNRVAAPQFPSTVCEVVHEQRWDAIRKRYVGAFSWTELGSLRRPRGTEWERAVDIAVAVYDDTRTPRVNGALFYHASHSEPSWARTKKQVAQIGRHIFYE